MSWTLKLDNLDHDLRIENGKFLRVNGSDEVRQRIKVSLWHYLGEYFLDTDNGVPWYEQLLGRKIDADIVSTIIRRQILLVPGVIRISSLIVQFVNVTRSYSLDTSVQVQAGPGELASTQNINMTLAADGDDIF